MRRTQLLIVLNLAFILSAAFVLNSFLNYRNYTLEKNGNWESSKTKLRAVNGVYAFMFTKVALCRNHLDLAAWFGNQELIYHESINWNSLSFRYHSSGNPFALLLDKTDSLTKGIYFNYTNDSICCLFIADREGKFLMKQNFYINEGEYKYGWNKAVVTRSADSVFLSLNNKIYLRTALPLPTSTHFGFRGGWYQVFIDDVAAYDASGVSVMNEFFAPPTEFYWQTAVVFLLFSTFLFWLYQSAYQTWVTPLSTSVLLGFIACYMLYFNYFSYLYPVDADSINWHGHSVNFDFEGTVCKRLDTEYAAAKGKPVILFIGSSQTWGAGASDAEHPYPALVEKKLRSYFNDSAITVINTGICGAKSDMVYKHYSQEWYKFHPVLTVIDLSHNDHDDTLMFSEYINRFLEFNKARHIKTLLVTEPHFYVPGCNSDVNHSIMKAEGDSFNVNTVDMQAFMDSSYAKGFLWWDFVHMTDYGYRLFAERITRDVIMELENDSLLFKFQYPVTGR